jgi:uncharacterized protein Yka (UPF0111/DUF47 family)
MNAFDMISEPVLFAQQLCEYSEKVHRSVELIQPLTDALLIGDYEKIQALNEQMREIRSEAERSRLSLYGQIQAMRFHSAGGDAFSQYMLREDKVAGASQAFAELLALRRTAVSVELHDDLRALVAEVVAVGRRTMDLAERLPCEAQAGCSEIEARDRPDALQGTADGRDQVRPQEMEFARRLYSLEKQLDPLTVVFLDKYRAALHDVAENAERAAEHLRRMVR